MHNAYIVTGTLTDTHTVALDEALPMTPMKVRLIVEPLSLPSQRPYQEVIAEIRERQQVRGHQPSTREEVDTYLPRWGFDWQVLYRHIAPLGLRNLLSKKEFGAKYFHSVR